MARYFGTDGVRGVAGEELTYDLAFALGQVATGLLGPVLVIGRDTRASGTWLEEALVAGIAAGDVRGGDGARSGDTNDDVDDALCRGKHQSARRGNDSHDSANGDGENAGESGDAHSDKQALLAGVIPTPAVALLVRELGANGGIVISASHNPPEYNGIKFFDAEGYKLDAATEAAFEKRLTELLEQGTRSAAIATATPPSTPTPCRGSSPILNASERYVAHAVAAIRARGINLAGLTIAIDCAHGAAFRTSPEALRQLGAEVAAINTSYDGTDINVDCGSTNLTPLKQLVAQVGADVGLAHDGDADRLIAVDAHGAEIDGDFIEAICALDLQKRNALPDDTIVSTVMCNLGFTLAMREHGIKVIQTAVGDSNVLARMREGGYALGGEQSGHMIFLEHNSTGDGLITALMLLAAMRSAHQPLHELASVMRKYPQVLLNIPDVDKSGLASNTALPIAVAAAEERLQASGGGRVLLRPSGTEPLIRVMVEAADEAVALQEAEALAALVVQELAL
ncbi:MAG: phosphoglucosamine mutase [Coriobacteriales bacterium]|jgi:phosphoglucosamine mutase|nr:phosphoglucosamine mutase [Coriobacteriales bacterium]